jgi:hypothetical protein
MSIFNIVTLIFVVLKLTNYIAWSWWFVLLPTIIFTVLWVVVTLWYSTMTPTERYLRSKGLK